MNKRNIRDIELELAHNGTAGKRVLIHNGDAASDFIYMNEAYLEPGMAIEAHHHSDMEEFYYILAGQGLMQVGEDVEPVSQGDRVIIPATVIHSLANTGDVGMTFITFGVRVRAKEPSHC